MSRCGDCLNYLRCSRWTTPNEEYAEIGGCRAFKPKRICGICARVYSENDVFEEAEYMDEDRIVKEKRRDASIEVHYIAEFEGEKAEKFDRIYICPECARNLRIEVEGI